MGAWERLQPVEIDPLQLPTTWELIRDQATGYYAVVGRSGMVPVDVVIRIDYAASQAGEDIRPLIGSAVLSGLRRLRHGAG